MTISQLSAAIIYIAALIGAVITIVTAVNLAVLKPAKKFIRSEIVGALEGIRKELSGLRERDDETAAALARHIREDHPGRP